MNDRRFELTELRAPTTIRWHERSTNTVTVPAGGYDLEPVGDAQIKVTIFNSFEGHGLGKLIVGFARKAAAKDVDAFAQRIQATVEASWSRPQPQLHQMSAAPDEHSREGRCLA